MTLGNDPSPEAVINVFPSLPVHSSVLVALIAGLFLAALIVRAQRMPSEASADPIMQRFSDRAARSARRRAQARLRRRQTRAERRAKMTATTTRDHARVADQPQAAHPGTHRQSGAGRPAASAGALGPQNNPRRGAGGFRIRWGRTLVALVGLLGLLVTAVTAPLAVFTPLLAAVPLTAGAVLLVSLVSLRSMAVARRRRRRRARIDAVMAEAMNPELPVEQQRRPGVPSTAAAQSTGVQDAVRHQAPSSEAVRSSAQQSPAESGSAEQRDLDEDGLPRDIAATFEEPAAQQEPSAQDAPALSAAAHRQSRESWQPREVPKPQYLEAEKAERAQPEPLVPEEPKPTTEVKIREDLPKTGTTSPAVAAPETSLEREELPATGTDGGPEAHARPAGVQQSLDLDAVLKRRRA